MKDISTVLQEIFEKNNPPFDAALEIENAAGTRKMVIPHATVKFSLIKTYETKHNT